MRAKKKFSICQQRKEYGFRDAKQKYSKPLNRRGDFVRELVEGVEVCLAYGDP